MRWVYHIQRILLDTELASEISLVVKVAGPHDTLVGMRQDLEARAYVGCRYDFTGSTRTEAVEQTESAVVPDERISTYVNFPVPASAAAFMASDSMYSEVPPGAPGNCNDHLICWPCSGASCARTSNPTICRQVS